MPIVTMPNGDRVNFPDSMSREQIRAKILEKFPEADPNRGALAKITEFGRGEARGLVQNAATVDKLTGGSGPVGKALESMPMIGAPLQAVRALGRAAGPWANEQVGSGYEQTGRFVGRDVLPMFGPGGVGKAVGAGLAEKATQSVAPAATLYLMSHFPHVMIPLLWKYPNLYSSLQGLAERAVPFMRGVGGAAGHVTERIGEGEAGQYIPGAPQDAEATPPSTPEPGPTTSPGAPDPGTPRAPRTTDPGRDADTDAPVAARSGKGDRLKPVFGGSTN